MAASKSFITVLLASLCCLLFTRNASAQAVYGYADMYYDEAINSMVFSVEAGMDYSTEAYYCVSVNAVVYKNNEPEVYFGDHQCSGITAGVAQAQVTLPYDPDAEYELESIPTLDTYLRAIDEEGGGGGGSGYNYDY